MINFKLSETEAKVAVTKVEKIGNYKDDAMLAFVTMYGAEGVEILNDCMHDQMDDAWAALGALEYWAKV